MLLTASQAISQIICGEPLKLEEQEWKSEIGPGIAAAQKKLTASIAQGEVRAFGRRTYHGPLENVPADIFRISDTEVVISPHGEVTSLRPHRPYQGEQWHSIELEADGIMRLYPSPPKQSVQEWMVQEAKRCRSEGKIGKREFLVRDCQKAKGCTSREALAAYKMLTPELRLKRGKPRMESV